LISRPTGLLLWDNIITCLPLFLLEAETSFKKTFKIQQATVYKKSMQNFTIVVVDLFY
jgi:hypothetical protein